MNEKQNGFVEIEHTADWALQVWAEDLSSLFEQAAHGMNFLAEVTLETGAELTQRISLEAGDPESLLVSFLDEILYFGEQEGVGFHTFAVQINANKLAAELRGASIANQKKEIKAVTFHNLEIVNDNNGCQVEIVFDV